MRNPSEEEQKQNRKMDVESLAKVVFRYLKDNLKPNPKSQLFYLLVDDLRKDLFSDRSDPQKYSDHATLLEAIILLERRGLVARDLPYGWLGGNQDKFMVHLTSAGIKSKIDDAVFLLVDKPEKTVGALEERVGNLDPVVRQYYVESLRAHQEELYISSVICLGAASERAIHWLAESIASSSPRYQGKLDKKRNISDLIKYLADSVIPNIFGNDKTFARELKELLDELGNLYRKNRNDAGHPKTVEQISWLGEGQAARLDLFRRYITTICESIERLKNNGNV